MSIHEQYESVLKECIFISKPNEWFLEGYQVEFIRSVFSWREEIRFNDNTAIVNGLTIIDYRNDLHLEEPIFDQDSHDIKEFEIYDKWGNEISELTLFEYKELLRNNKIEEVNV